MLHLEGVWEAVPKKVEQGEPRVTLFVFVGPLM
jgi:hypothetical protein